MNVRIRYRTRGGRALLETYCREVLKKSLRAKVQQVVDVEINKMREQAESRKQWKEAESLNKNF